MQKLIKECRAVSPSQEHPLRFKLKDLVDNPVPDTELEAYLEWQDGSWGTKIPCLVIQPIQMTGVSETKTPIKPKALMRKPNKKKVKLELRRERLVHMHTSGRIDTTQDS